MQIPSKLYLQQLLSSSITLTSSDWYKLGCIFGVSILVIWKAKNYWSTTSKNRRLQKLIDIHRIERDEVIRKIKSELANADEAIVEKRKWLVGLPTKELADLLQRGDLKPVEVLEAFQSAALAANEITNCITQFISDARAECEKLEKEYDGSLDKPPLYGIPFSVKESIGVCGNACTVGLVQHLLLDPLTEEGALVTRLRQLGAVPFVLSNVPQTLLSFNCSNPIYGLTMNPRNAKRTCGGSSGGEGALLACRGSPLGLGSDLAGSIRIPSHFCGVVGLKPCSARLSQQGGRKALFGRTVVPASYGPMANDVDTLVLFMDQVLHEAFFRMDSNVAPLPFRRDVYDSDKKLRIGYYDYDGFTEVVPACRRAVHTAKRILEKGGHELVPFRPQGIAQFASLAASLFSIDSGQALLQVLRKDVVDSVVGEGFKWFALPIFVRKLISKVAFLKGEKKLGTITGSLDTMTYELGATLAAVIEFKANFNSEWRRRRLDAVICPPCATVATPHDPDESWKIFPAFFYTCIYNVLDYPAGIVPVTEVTADDEWDVLTAAGYDELKEDFYAKCIRRCNQKGETAGLPVGVQCVAATYNEEVCLRVMKEIESGVRKSHV